MASAETGTLDELQEQTTTSRTPLLSNPVLEGLRGRITQLLPAGLDSVWMHSGSDDAFHICNVLGVPFEDWEGLLRFSGLSKCNGALLFSTWEEKLQLKVTTRDYRTSGASKWFQFGEQQSANETRTSRSSSSRSHNIGSSSYESCDTPGDEKAQESILAFYDKVELIGVLRDTHLSSPGVQSFIASQLAAAAAAAEEEEEEIERRFRQLQRGRVEEEKKEEDNDAAAVLESNKRRRAKLLTLFQQNSDSDQMFLGSAFMKSKEMHNKVVLPMMGGSQVYWRFPVMQKKTVDSDTYWTRFLRNFPISLMTNLVETVCGSLEMGVECFARVLHRIDPKAVLRGIGKEGAIVMAKKIDPIGTLTIMSNSEITTTARLSINKDIRYYTGGKSIFSSENLCKAEQSKNKLPELHFKTFKGSIGDNATPEAEEENNEDDVHGEVADFKDVEIEYMYKKPEDVLMYHIRTLRDGAYDVKLGVDLGVEGCCVPMVYEADHGANHMQFVVVISSHEEAAQKFNYNIGSFKYKESYDVLKSVVIPEVNAGIGVLNARFLLVIEWIGGWDAILVPRLECSAETHIDRQTWPPGLMTRNCLQMIHGRQNHANTKCITCDANQGAFRHEHYEGVKFSHEIIMAEVRNYRIGNAAQGDELLENMSEAEISDIKKRSQAACKKSGIS